MTRLTAERPHAIRMKKAKSLNRTQESNQNIQQAVTAKKSVTPPSCSSVGFAICLDEAGVEFGFASAGSDQRRTICAQPHNCFTKAARRQEPQLTHSPVTPSFRG